MSAFNVLAKTRPSQGISLPCSGTLAGGGAGPRQSVEISGTWDFKWPLGTAIRVAFQRPPAGTVPELEFSHAKNAVERYAKRWLPLLAECELGLEFTGADLDPPLGPAHSTVDQHRSVFAPSDPRDKPYDVLISLADLPVTRVERFQACDAPCEPIAFPISELGSYARRLDYGTPTMYLGRSEGARRSYGDDRTGFMEYLASDLAANIVVHEVGHMLGLPHLHQHPALLSDRAAYYRSPSEIQELLGALLGERPSVELIERNVLAVWPGNLEFSDWLPLSVVDVERHAKHCRLDSIMTHPYYEYFGRSGRALEQARDAGAIPVATMPGALDAAMLRRMYDPEYEVEALASLPRSNVAERASV